jgi:HAD superfamily hydrolase (TIGR01490 family)
MERLRIDRKDSIMTVIALFDLDNTLLKGDSEYLWSRFLRQKKQVNLLFGLRMAAYFHDYANGTLNLPAYEAFLLSPLVSLPVGQGQALLDEYHETIRSVFRPSMLARLDWHRQQGHLPILISASNHLIVQPIADRLNIPVCICTQAEMKEGRPTGKLSGTPAFRDGKLTRLDAWLAENGISSSDLWAYSDSYNDMPLLLRAFHPVAVAPDKRLAAHAQRSGWEIIDR